MGLLSHLAREQKPREEKGPVAHRTGVHSELQGDGPSWP